jgi:hypothetical protein
MLGISLSRLLVASVIAGIIAVSGLLVSPSQDHSVSNIEVAANVKTVKVGDTFKVSVVVDAVEPINVFKGLLHFDSDKLTVTSIDYNVSIANLWAEEPWYSNGDGTLGFIGGTTMNEGFIGRDQLLTITFSAKTAGEATLRINDVTLLKHDGLGSEAELGQPIDSIFVIENPAEKVVVYDKRDEEKVLIVTEPKSTDLNADGKQNFTDISIFMVDLTQGNLRSDFNNDGKVSLRDLSILTQ